MLPMRRSPARNNPRTMLSGMLSIITSVFTMAFKKLLE